MTWDGLEHACPVIISCPWELVSAPWGNTLNGCSPCHGYQISWKVLPLLFIILASIVLAGLCILGAFIY